MNATNIICFGVLISKIQDIRRFDICRSLATPLAYLIFT